MATLDEAEAWLRAGRAREAFDAAGEHLVREPTAVRALAVRANAAIALQELDAAVDALQTLRGVRPNQPAFARTLAAVRNNRGRARRAAGDRRGALEDLRSAVVLDAAHPQAWFNLALAALDDDAPLAAREAIARHLALAPQDLEARRVQASLAAPDEARAFLDGLAPGEQASLEPGALAWLAARVDRAALAQAALARLSPRDDLTAATAALVELGHAGEARAARVAGPAVVAARRTAGRSTWRAELAAALGLPAIPRGLDDLQAARRDWFEGLARLEADWTTARLAQQPPTLGDLAHSNFLLAYQGSDDREAQARFAALLQRAAHAARPAWAEPPTHAPRGRVGLLSSGWRACTVGSYFGGWIDWLRDAGLEVVLYQLGPQRDATTDALAARASRFVFLDGPLEQVAARLREDALDLLLYPELGMDARLMPLAALRLARRQAMAWGHPVTGGFTTIDDFLTCGDMEPAGAAAHYSERLVPLPGLGVDYRQPALPARVAPAAFGLDASRPRVLVPQSLFKLHPEGDAVIAAVAAARPDVQFVLFAPERASWFDAFRLRLDAALAAVGARFDSHVALLPLGSRERYLQVNLACDVMLDSLHWSGGNTALDALACGLPLVACPGRFMRGRQSHAMLGRLGLQPALSLSTPEAQAARVVELLAAHEARETLSRTLRERLPALFEADAAREAFVAWARDAAAR